jgi:hypothetical protein
MSIDQIDSSSSRNDLNAADTMEISHCDPLDHPCLKGAKNAIVDGVQDKVQCTKSPAQLEEDSRGCDVSFPKCPEILQQYPPTNSISTKSKLPFKITVSATDGTHRMAKLDAASYLLTLNDTLVCKCAGSAPFCGTSQLPNQTHSPSQGVDATNATNAIDRHNSFLSPTKPGLFCQQESEDDKIVSTLLSDAQQTPSPDTDVGTLPGDSRMNMEESFFSGSLKHGLQSPGSMETPIQKAPHKFREDISPDQKVFLKEVQII